MPEESYVVSKRVVMAVLSVALTALLGYSVWQVQNYAEQERRWVAGSVQAEKLKDAMQNIADIEKRLQRLQRSDAVIRARIEAVERGLRQATSTMRGSQARENGGATRGTPYRPE